MRILVADPDPVILRHLEVTLGADRFNVYCTDTAEETLELAKLYDYDAITLELDMPDFSGFDVIRRLRDARKKTPILVLSHFSDMDLRLRALDLGADDYMTKPFDNRELIARLSALVRRSQGVASRVITIGEVSLDLNKQDATVCGAPVHLTGSEYQILRRLMLSAGVVQSKERILNALYGGMDEPDAKIVDVFVCKLRKKLAAAGALEHFVETVWGRGYMVSKGAPAMTSEVREIINEPPVYVSRLTVAEREEINAKKRFGQGAA